MNLATTDFNAINISFEKFMSQCSRAQKLLSVLSELDQKDPLRKILIRFEPETMIKRGQSNLKFALMPIISNNGNGKEIIEKKLKTALASFKQVKLKVHIIPHGDFHYYLSIELF